MGDQDALAKMTAAIDGSTYRWRTSQGIAKDTGLEYVEVTNLLNKSGVFLKARKPNERGEALFTTTTKYKTDTPIVGRIIGAAANTISSKS